MSTHAARGTSPQIFHSRSVCPSALLVGLMAVLIPSLTHGQLKVSHSGADAAMALYEKGCYGDAEDAFRKLVVASGQAYGPDHPDTLAQRNNLANTLNAAGRPQEAEMEHRQVLALRERILGAEHPDTLSSRNNLATALQAQGKSAEAAKEYRFILRVRERLFGAENLEVLKTCFALALSLEAQGRVDEALSLARRAAAGWDKTLGRDHPASLRASGAVWRLKASLKN